MTSIKIFRWACAVTFVCGLAGIIVSSIAGNNEGEAEYLETKIDEQVKKGASEEELRDIVRRAIALGQRSA